MNRRDEQKRLCLRTFKKTCRSGKIEALLVLEKYERLLEDTHLQLFTLESRYPRAALVAHAMYQIERLAFPLPRSLRTGLPRAYHAQLLEEARRKRDAVAVSK